MRVISIDKRTANTGAVREPTWVCYSKVKYCFKISGYLISQGTKDHSCDVLPCGSQEYCRKECICLCLCVVVCASLLGHGKKRETRTLGTLKPRSQFHPGKNSSYLTSNFYSYAYASLFICIKTFVDVWAYVGGLSCKFFRIHYDKMLPVLFYLTSCWTFVFTTLHTLNYSSQHLHEVQ